jgi:hypothetical protein
VPSFVFICIAIVVEDDGCGVPFTRVTTSWSPGWICSVGEPIVVGRHIAEKRIAVVIDSCLIGQSDFQNALMAE